MFERRVVGQVPAKHHLQLRDAKGHLLYEECLTRDGFEGAYTIAYHQRAPHTQSLADCKHGWWVPEPVATQRLAKRHYRTQDLVPAGGAPLHARVPLLFNADVTLGVLHPSEEDPAYFVNADADDLFYIHTGGGVLRSPLGDLRFEAEDYVFVPRGLSHRFIPDKGVKQYWLSIECKGGLHIPRQWRNDVGQLRMDAPYCHRDFRTVEFKAPRDEGLRELVVKRGDVFHGFLYQHSPLDVVGWDGAVYPWAFPILNFQPRVGPVHLPPSWHGTFATRGALICSFVPRPVDYHPQAVPCPYPHASVDCDEFLFYCRGSFTSRRGVGPGSVSLHPAGVAHGPHPGAYEGSLGQRETDELAVMLDTTLPLEATAAAVSVEDPDYQRSFLP
jgi:homogentisate 1,2-dioxygenase